MFSKIMRVIQIILSFNCLAWNRVINTFLIYKLTEMEGDSQLELKASGLPAAETPADIEAGMNGTQSKNMVGAAEIEEMEAGLRVIQIYVQGVELKNMDQGRDKSDT